VDEDADIVKANVVKIGMDVDIRGVVEVDVIGMGIVDMVYVDVGIAIEEFIGITYIIGVDDEISEIDMGG
ncbi:hypothetical protein KI387_019921, partial [Taxus chinensis]